MVDYLSPIDQNITISEQKYIFKCRSGDLSVKMNKPWLYYDRKCAVCHTVYETQQHVLECRELCNKNNAITYIPSYSELFGEILEERIYVAKILQQNMRLRETYKYSIIRDLHCYMPM